MNAGTYALLWLAACGARAWASDVAPDVTDSSADVLALDGGEQPAVDSTQSHEDQGGLTSSGDLDEDRPDPCLGWRTLSPGPHRGCYVSGSGDLTFATFGHDRLMLDAYPDLAVDARGGPTCCRKLRESHPHPSRWHPC